MSMRMLSVFTILFATSSSGLPASAQTTVPENASPTLGAYLGWTCDPGYQRIGITCRKFELPANARYYGTGNNWRCLRGYRRSGNQCLIVIVPPNAQLNIIGNGWVCNPGFIRTGPACILRLAPRGGL